MAWRTWPRRTRALQAKRTPSPRLSLVVSPVSSGWGRAVSPLVGLYRGSLVVAGVRSCLPLAGGVPSTVSEQCPPVLGGAAVDRAAQSRGGGVLSTEMRIPVPAVMS